MLTTVLALSFLVPATLAAAYYMLLSILGRFPRTVPRPAVPATKLAILIPAHNEKLSLPALLDSIQRCDYPRDLLNVTVVADNCTDDTSKVARAAGVNVIERKNPIQRGKGFALGLAIPQILKTIPDAVLILDADGEIEPDAFHFIDACIQNGDRVVQGSIRTRNPDQSASSLVAAVGNAFDDRMSAGRDRLGWQVPLRGSNMAFCREVLERHPWKCHGLTEDAEYSGVLRKSGIRVRFESRARVRSESPARMNDLRGQRRRWRAALRLRNCLESKPLVLFHLSITTALIAILLVVEFISIQFILWNAAIWFVTLLTYCLVIYDVGMSYFSKCFHQMPHLLLALITVSLGRLLRNESEWQRTRRAAES